MNKCVIPSTSLNRFLLYVVNLFPYFPNFWTIFQLKTAYWFPIFFQKKKSTSKPNFEMIFFRDEKRLKRSLCIQWERNEILRSVPTVYRGNALIVSRPWFFLNVNTVRAGNLGQISTLTPDCGALGLLEVLLLREDWLIFIRTLFFLYKILAVPQ